MNKIPFLLLFLSFYGFSLSAQNNFDIYAEAQKMASETNKLILINFSGSDWCNPCIRMEKEIFSTSVFEELIQDDLIFYKADFPRLRKNKLSKELTKQNENLAEKYNQKGVFPMTILIDADGEIIKSWEGYPKMTVNEFAAEIRQNLPVELKIKKKVYSRTLKLMGNRFDISVVSESEIKAEKAIDVAIKEIMRIEKLISSWDPESETSKINNNAGINAVEVDSELIELISRSIKISEITQGAFDISFGSVDKDLWKFDGSMTKMPDAVTAAESVKLINYRNIQADPDAGTVFLKEKGMRIGFGAIGKGYAAEMAKSKLKELGIEAGVVNASGDMTIWGTHPEHQYWTVGIADPDSKQHVFSSLEIKDQAVVTSGNYEKFVIIDGKKYSHIIDPRTGYPASGLKSVTVIASNAELADALATAIFIMGKDVGIDLVNQLANVNCIIINEENKIFYSNGININ